jgi:hypothetical protein
VASASADGIACRALTAAVTARDTVKASLKELTSVV